MTETELQAIEARAAKATPGPWKPVPQADGKDICIAPEPPGFWETIAAVWIDLGTYGANAEANADFMSAARTDVPALVKALREAREDASLVKYYFDRVQKERNDMRLALKNVKLLVVSRRGKIDKDIANALLRFCASAGVEMEHLR